MTDRLPSPWYKNIRLTVPGGSALQQSSNQQPDASSTSEVDEASVADRKEKVCLFVQKIERSFCRERKVPKVRVMKVCPSVLHSPQEGSAA